MAGLVLVLFLMLTGCTINSDGDNARSACEELVRNQLKPSASFDVSDTKDVSTGSSSWRVTTRVDFLNSKGSTVRSESWMCQIRREGDDYTGSAAFIGDANP